jgi:flagellar basal-body rod protein FlgF
MKEIYTALSGATAAARQVEILSNNIANATTQGFREERATFRLFQGVPLVGDVGYSRVDGELQRDGVPSHLALRGDGFFTLGDGSFTRDGDFRVDSDGTLVTREGTAVLGDSGPIRLDPKEDFTVTLDGKVTGSTSGEVGRVLVSTVAGGVPLGGNRWSGSGTPTDDVQVVQGAREGSNADPMRSMVELIEASRFFEMQQKVLQTSDELRGRLNQIKG